MKNQDKDFIKLIEAAIFGITAGTVIACVIMYYFLKLIFLISSNLAI